MIDHIEQILTEINNALDLEGNTTYRGIFFSKDDWHFIHKCLANYQLILVKEINKND